MIHSATELALRAQSAIDFALAGWKKGHPRSELAYINRLTELLHWGFLCDITRFRYPVWVDVGTYDLHQQGDRNSDRFGADLAVTVIDRRTNRTKTALFQVKRTSRDWCRLQFHQLQEAATAKAILDRSFVFAFDEYTDRTKVVSVRNRLIHWPIGQKSLKVNTSHWLRSATWIEGWLICQRGPFSDAADGYPVEAELARHAMGQEEFQRFFRGDEAGRLAVRPLELPTGYSIARQWMVVQIRDGVGTLG